MMGGPDHDRPVSRTLCVDCRHFEGALRRCARFGGLVIVANRARLAPTLCGEDARHFAARVRDSSAP